MVKPKKTVFDLSHDDLVVIVSKVQEAIWLEDNDWLLPDDVDYDITDEVAKLFIEHGLEPVETEDCVPEPDEGDLITEDHRHFWEYPRRYRQHAVVVPEGEDWEPYVDAWMAKNQYWPNVWSVSDHGNLNLLDMSHYNNPAKEAK